MNGVKIGEGGPKHKFLSKLMGIPKAIAKAQWAVMKANYQAVKFAAKHLVVNPIKAFMNRQKAAIDVYRKDDLSRPLIYANRLKAGAYILRKSMTVIYDVAEITGEIIDRQGNVVISDDDLRAGICDRNGNAIKGTLGSRIVAKIKQLPGAALGLAKKGVAAGISKIRGMGRSDDSEESIRSRKRGLNFDTLKRQLRSKIGGFMSRAKLDISEVAGVKTVGLLEDVSSSMNKLIKAVKGIKPGEDSGGDSGGLIGTAKSLLMGAGGTAVAGEAAAGVGAAAGAVGGTGMLAMAGSAASGALAFLGSPVVLGAIAIGVAAYGGYKLYKHLSRGDLNPVELIRYVQYGFDKDNDKYKKRMVDLEVFLSEYIVLTNGMPMIQPDKIDAAKFLNIVEVSPDDKEAKQAFYAWFQGRFKPVFLTHIAAIKSVTGKMDLSEIGGLKKEEGLKYIQQAEFANGPYSYSAVPFISDTTALTTADDVKAQVKAAREFYGEKDTEGKKDETAPTESVGPSEAVAAPMETDEDGDVLLEGNGYDIINDPEPSADGSVGASPATSITGSYGGSDIVTKEVDAFQAIRFKAYGLKDMEIEKVNNLKALEMAYSLKLTFTNKEASWSGTYQDVIKIAGPVFGVTPTDTLRSDKVYRWFVTRFMPVYLKYASGMARVLGQFKYGIGEMALTVDEKINIGKEIIAADGVWSRDESPWLNYTLNTDSSTTDGHFKFLDESKKTNTLATNKNSSDTSNDNTAGAKKEQSVMDRIRNFFSGSKETGSGGQTAGTSVTSSPSGAPSAAPSSTAPGASASGSSGSSQAAPGGSGVGYSGGITATPTEAADPSIGVPAPPPQTEGLKAVGPTVIAAAKKVGVNVQNALSTVAIESAFRPWASAQPSSSAGGLYQFIDSTWKTMLDTYGKKYGFGPGTSKFDPVASALLGSEFMKMNENAVRKIKPDPNPVDIYFAHFFGTGGVKQFLSNLKANPDAPAADVMQKAAAANRPAFYANGGKGAALSFRQIYDMYSERITKKMKAFGIDIGDPNSAVSKMMGGPISSPASDEAAKNKATADAVAAPGATPAATTGAQATQAPAGKDKAPTGAPSASGAPSSAGNTASTPAAPVKSASPAPAASPTPAATVDPGPVVSSPVVKSDNRAAQQPVQPGMDLSSTTSAVERGNKILESIRDILKEIKVGLADSKRGSTETKSAPERSPAPRGEGYTSGPGVISLKKSRFSGSD